MQTLDVAKLTTCKVAPDGQAISLAAEDGSGKPFQLRITAEQAGMLAMTLPQLLTEAIQARHRDHSMRYVFPLGGFELRAADGHPTAILSLRTPDGFEVSFAVQPNVLASLATVCASGGDGHDDHHFH